MPRLLVRQVAEKRELNMSQLQRQSGLTMGVIRRYWYNTTDGKAEGPELEMVSLTHLGAIARVLNVATRELIGNGEVIDSGNSLELRNAA